MRVAAGPVYYGVGSVFVVERNIMSRKLMITAQVLVCAGLMAQLAGCIFVDGDRRGHFVHRGAYHGHEHRAENGVELDIKLRN